MNGFCTCKPGYTGAGCNSVCPQYYFGANCESKCNCAFENGATCDPMSGKCICPPGYTGQRLRIAVRIEPKEILLKDVNESAHKGFTGFTATLLAIAIMELCATFDMAHGTIFSF